jgi:hypothetical protein
MYSWQDDYLATLAETDPKKLRRRFYEATAAIEQRRLSHVDPNSEEHDALERAEKALKIVEDSLRTEERKIDYWRVVILYTDGTESANKIFKDRARAEKWAKRQARSKVVEKCRLEPFTRDLGQWRKPSE